MAILLFSDVASCASALHGLLEGPADAPLVLLCAGDGNTTQTPLSSALAAVAPGLFVVDVNGGRFHRINFDAVRAAILDLDPETLLSSPGRRLVEVLAQLSSLHEGGPGLDLVLVGAAAGVAGGVLLDGIHAGLGLLPATAIAPDLKAVDDLRVLLLTLSGGRGRLVALDAPVGVRYSADSDMVKVAGAGSALLVAFVAGSARSGEESPPPVARLHVVTDGMQSTFPNA